MLHSLKSAIDLDEKCSRPRNFLTPVTESNQQKLTNIFTQGNGCEIRKVLNVESLLRIEEYQLQWLGHVSWMSQERLARQFLLTTPTGKLPRGRLSTRWSDYISDLLVLSWCGASRTIWKSWKPWGTSSLPRVAVLTPRAATLFPRWKVVMKMNKKGLAVLHMSFVNPAPC